MAGDLPGKEGSHVVIVFIDWSLVRRQTDTLVLRAENGQLVNDPGACRPGHLPQAFVQCGLVRGYRGGFAEIAAALE